MDKKLVDAVNRQINFEFASAYLYLGMSVVMTEKNIHGFAKWLRRQWHEELEHAEMMMDFMESRNEKVVLSAIEFLPVTGEKPLELAKEVLAHEKKVTANIWDIRKMARELDDQALEVFLDHFVKEQVEEETNAQALVDKFVFAGDDKNLQFAIDCSLSAK